jgi:hypothetical protein
MELVFSGQIVNLAANTWGDPAHMESGPGTFVWLVRSWNTTGTETFDARLQCFHPDIDAFIVESATCTAGGLAAYAGYQSQPVPLLDATWQTGLLIRHTKAGGQTFDVRLLKL